MTEKINLDDKYEKFIKSYQYYVFEDQFENFQENSQKYEKFYDSSFHNYNNINDIYFVNKKVEHLYNKYNISFSLKNKLFNYLRETYRKFKISFDADFQATAFMINNVKVIIIIHFIAELRDVIVKSNYNFRN